MVAWKYIFTVVRTGNKIIFLAAILVASGSGVAAHAQIIQLPDCNIVPNDPFCVAQCVFIDPPPPWCEQEPTPTPSREPVLIVPGIMGSELYQDDDLIWADLSQMFSDVNDQFLTDSLSLDGWGEPLNNVRVGEVIKEMGLSSSIIFKLEIFNRLISDLQSTGYVIDDSLFLFPYDWRLDLDNPLPQLRDRIETIKQQTGAAKVNIIAHSMGGLLVKDYLHEYGNSSIDKLIFIGTPHLGAPKAAKTLLAGDRFGIPWLEEDRMMELSRNSPSVYELLPNAKYFTEFTGYIRKYGNFTPGAPLNYEENKEFLLGKDLNAGLFNRAEQFWQKDLADVDLTGLDVYNIAGCQKATQAGYQYAYNNSFIGNVKYTSGDETVPLPSANYVATAVTRKYYAADGEHSSLPSLPGVRGLISDILAGGELNTHTGVSTDISTCDFKGKEMVWKSPVAVHVYDSQGHHTGPAENNAIEYGIDGVTYDIISDEKFIFLPTNNGETYTVVADALSAGSFDLTIADNENGATSAAAVFNDVPLTPDTQIRLAVNDAPVNAIEVDAAGNGAWQNQPADAVLNETENGDLTPPQTSASLAGPAGQNGWYLGATQLTLTASDDQAGVLSTRISLDGGQNYTPYTEPVTINHTGTTEVIFYSVDRAGNNEAVQQLSVKIDNTPPEIKAAFDPAKPGFVWQAQDAIDASPELVCTLDKCQAIDEAGHTTIARFKQQKFSRWHYTLTLSSVQYDSDKTIFPVNLFLVKWKENGRRFQDFNQTLLVKSREIVRAVYDDKKDQSVLWSLQKHGSPARQTMPGMKIVELATDQGELAWSIK